MQMLVIAILSSLCFNQWRTATISLIEVWLLIFRHAYSDIDVTWYISIGNSIPFIIMFEKN